MMTFRRSQCPFTDGIIFHKLNTKLKLVTALFLYLSGCVSSGYQPTYIISDTSNEEMTTCNEENR
jgi:hypothetical protein